MDRSNIITLIKSTYAADTIGQLVPVERTRDVYCNLRSVTRSEWSAAGQLGLKPELTATMFAPDYEGEELAEIDGVRYGVYRTYIGSNESIELYLERKTGATNG